MSEITIEMTERRKRREIWLTVIGGPLYAAIGLSIFVYAYLQASDNYFATSQHIVAWLFGLGLPIWILWIHWSSWKRLKRENWTGIKFRVDESGIRKEFPNGEVVNANWQDLKYVSLSERIFYFEDGHAIRIHYSPKGNATVEDEEWLAIVKQSGTDSILAKATIERDATKPNMNAEWGIRIGFLLCIVLLGLLFHDNPSVAVSGFVILAVALNYSWYRIHKPQKDVDKRYAPPEDFQATVR